MKKKSGKGPLFWNWKPFFTVVLVLILGYIVYGIINPHPGYRKLEQQLDELKLPADWVEIGPRTGEKDKVLGLTRCRDIDISCPSISTVYKADSLGINPITIFESILSLNQYSLQRSTHSCQEKIDSFTKAASLECQVQGIKDKTKLFILVSSTDSLHQNTIQVGLTR